MPSWTTVATTRPARSKKCPMPRPRDSAAAGDAVAIQIALLGPFGGRLLAVRLEQAKTGQRDPHDLVR